MYILAITWNEIKASISTHAFISKVLLAILIILEMILICLVSLKKGRRFLFNQGTKLKKLLKKISIRFDLNYRNSSVQQESHLSNRVWTDQINYASPDLSINQVEQPLEEQLKPLEETQVAERLESLVKQQAKDFASLEERVKAIEAQQVNQLNQNSQLDSPWDKSLINQAIADLLAQIIQQLEERFNAIETQVHQLDQKPQTVVRSDTDDLIDQLIKELFARIIEQGSKSLEERLQTTQDQVDQPLEDKFQNIQNQLNQFVEEKLQKTQDQINQSVEGKLQNLQAQINQSLEEQLQPIETKLNQVQSLEERLQAIETQVQKPIQDRLADIQSDTNSISQNIETPSEQKITDNLNGISKKDDENDENLLDTSDLDRLDQRPELSPYAKNMISEFNKRTANFNQFYASCRLTLSMRGKGFGKDYKSGTQTLTKSSQFQDDKNGIFWAIKDQDTNKYLLVLNQDRLTPKQLQNTFEFSLKHISQVFDGGDEYNRNKHTGVKIIYPAIVVKKGKQLELKVRGKIEFYSLDEDF